MVATSSAGSDASEFKGNPWSGRNIFNGVMTGLTFFAAFMALVVLGTILFFTLSQGLGGLTLDGFTRLTPAPTGVPFAQLTPEQKGGFANALLGTLTVVSIATVLSVPIGILGAIYLSEFSTGKRQSQIADSIRFGVKVLSGVPSIIAGVFAYGVLVATTKTYSALAGGAALGVLMLPIIILSTEEALKLVPQEVRAASLALGATNFQTISKVVLPAALPVIFTGITLAVARASGETAPLIFTALSSPFWPKGLLQPIASLSVMIYNFALVPFPNQKALAWAGSMVLVLLVLLTSVIFRILLRPKTLG